MGVQYNTIENVAIASFETSWKNDSANKPIKSIVAEITPTQDLHGYEYPWPAGGGKNLAKRLNAKNGTINGITFTMNEDLSVIVDGTSTSTWGRTFTNYNYKQDKLNVPVGVELYVDTYPASEHINVVICYTTGSGTRTLNGGTKVKGPYVVPADATTSWLRINVDDYATVNNETISPFLCLYSEQDKSFAPYSNICPITGRTEVTAYISGRNLITSWNASSRRSNYIRVDLSNGPYVLSYQGTETSIRFWLLYYDANLNYKGRSVGGLHNKLVIYGTSNIFADGSGTLNENNVTFIACQVYTYTGPNLNDEPLQFEAGDIVTPYAGRTGTTRSLTWQSEAGEVYSGTVDIVTGMLSVTGVGKVFDGTESWTIMSPDDHERTFFRYVDNRGACPIDTDKASSHFRNVGVFTTNTAIGYHAYTPDSQPTVTCIQIRPGLGLFTTADWKAWLAAQYAAGTPVECWWTISEPIVYRLTGQQINTLLGTNNVWTDSGNIKRLMWQYTIFDLLQVFINGFEITDLIAFGGWQRDRNDVDGPEAGRTLDARMHRARVATKMRYNVTCRPLLAEELAALERLIMPEYVTVKVVGDPYYGTWERTCYVNNTNAKYLIHRRNGAQWWGGITFPIIEV